MNAAENGRHRSGLLEPRPVSFKCPGTVEEGVARLKAAIPGRPDPGPDHDMDSSPPPGWFRNVLWGTVTAESVTLAYGAVVDWRAKVAFHGAWKTTSGEVRLEGHLRARPGARRVLIAFYLGLALLLYILRDVILAPGHANEVQVGAFVVLAIALFVFPIVVQAMRADRAADEHELVRAIGATLGDPSIPPARWRTWQDEG
jgi:hypothetical protein